VTRAALTVGTGNDANGRRVFLIEYGGSTGHDPDFLTVGYRA